MEVEEGVIQVVIDADRTDSPVVFQDRLQAVDHIRQKAVPALRPLDIEQPAAAHVLCEQLFLLFVEADPVFRGGDRLAFPLEQEVNRIVEEVFLVEIAVPALIGLNEDVRVVAGVAGQRVDRGAPGPGPVQLEPGDVEIPPDVPAAVEVGNDGRRLPAGPGEVLDAQQVESFPAPRRVRPAVLVRRQLALLDERQGFGRRPRCRFPGGRSRLREPSAGAGRPRCG